MRRAVSAAVEAGTPIGAGGSRLLRGNCAEHESLEAEAAAFFGAEAAIFFRQRLYRQFRRAHDVAAAGRSARARSACPCQHSRGRARRPRRISLKRGITMPTRSKPRSAMALARRHGAGLDRGREPLQHGRRFRAARCTRRDRRPARRVPDGGRGPCHRRLRPSTDAG